MVRRLLTLLMVLAGVFVLSAEAVRAADFYFFRIDTELNVPLDTTGGVTVRWRCNGSGEGIITDGTASESTNLRDGIVKVASTSVENNAAHAGCNATESITATASFGGWVTRKWTDTVSAAGSNTTFTTRASLDYTIVINGVADELGTALTLNGTTASATYSGTVASQSYSGGKRYIAGSTSGGTVTGGADGYVNRISSALTISATASQSVDFGTTDDSSLDESGLLFGHKITLNKNDRTGGHYYDITGATITAGNSGGTICTESSGVYYCPVPIANTATTATATSIPVGGETENATCTYTDRTVPSGAQTTCTITANEPASGGSGSFSPLPISTPTPTATPSPEPSASPSVSPIPSAQVTPAPVSATAVKLFREAGNPRVYQQAADRTLRWVRTLEEFTAAGFRWQDVSIVPLKEIAGHEISSPVIRVQPDTRLNVRSGPGVQYRRLGQILSGQRFGSVGKEGIWYRIIFSGGGGWVHGDYVTEE